MESSSTAQGRITKCNGLTDIRQFFSYMNDISFLYVVLRNWDNLPDNVEIGGHGDLDLLVYDKEHFMEIFPQAESVFPSPRVRYKLTIGNTHIYMDVRYLGDGYYPIDFEREILNNREFNLNGFYTPSPLHFRLALAYHTVHHKGVNTYERFLGSATIQELLESLKESNIGWESPVDTSVGKFNAYYKGATSIVEKKENSVVKKQTAYKDYDLLKNEARLLNECQSIHFPRIIAQSDDTIEIEDCGELLTVNNIPDDWKQQLISILLELKAHNVQHRDIKPDNLMVKNGIIKLIDWGWARLNDDLPDDPPACLGYPYRASWGSDDNFAMRKIIKEIEFKLEERAVSI